MPENLPLFVLVLALVSFWAGGLTQRWSRRVGRRPWRIEPWSRPSAKVLPLRKREDGPLIDPADQLRVVMRSEFAKRPLLSKKEARVFYAAEKVIAEERLTWRVMAQVSLGEVLTSKDAKAYSAINSKRVDLLLITSAGEPVAAIEYQGSGHYRGTAPARDAVKKEALRRAGVHYIEVTPEHAPKDLKREIQRIAGLRPAAE